MVTVQFNAMRCSAMIVLKNNNRAKNDGIKWKLHISVLLYSLSQLLFRKKPKENIVPDNTRQSFVMCKLVTVKKDRKKCLQKIQSKMNCFLNKMEITQNC